ncbi:hypothetical protein [Streptomyces sp. NPDC057676]
MLARFDGYDYDCSKSDLTTPIWYRIELGNTGDEEMEMFTGPAHSYTVGSWYGSDRSYLAVDLANPDDERIFEFTGEDVFSAHIAGEPADASIQAAFESYSSMLARVIELKTQDGTVLRAC